MSNIHKHNVNWVIFRKICLVDSLSQCIIRGLMNQSQRMQSSNCSCIYDSSFADQWSWDSNAAINNCCIQIFSAIWFLPGTLIKEIPSGPQLPWMAWIWDSFAAHDQKNADLLIFYNLGNSGFGAHHCWCSSSCPNKPLLVTKANNWWRFPLWLIIKNNINSSLPKSNPTTIIFKATRGQPEKNKMHRCQVFRIIH